ncbi:hypothetical protein Tco_0304256 [Tanacetum coccineum]
MTRNKLINEWDGFLESVRNQFGPSKYEDLQGTLSKLLQTGMVAQYQSEFEKHMNRVTDIPETLLISFNIPELKPNLQREFLVSKPMTLGKVFSLARIIEAHLEDQAAPATGNASKTMTSFRNQKQSTPRLGITSLTVNANKPSMLPTPPQTTINENTKPFADDDTVQESKADALDTIENDDISILNSLNGQGSPRSLQL